MSSTFEQIKQPQMTQLETRVNKGAMNLAPSWYIAMQSKELGKKPKALELFGQSLVAWRDQNNHPVIMERFCSHFGASLAIGQVVDGCIQCPFHHWRYDRSGQCVSIPEVDHIPPTARQTTYVTAERYGYIWMWYGSQPPLFPLPEFPLAESDRHKYMPLYFVKKTKAPVRQVIENLFDYSHIVSVHKMKFSGSIQLTRLDDQHPAQQSEPSLQKEAWFRVLYELPIKSRGGKIGAVDQTLGFKIKTLTMRVDVWPSGVISKNFVNGEEMYQALFCATPVAENRTNLWCLLAVKKTGKLWLDIPYYVFFTLRNTASLEQDIPIWNTMQPDAGGVYIKHDWAVLNFRKFYQSWVDKAK